MLTTDHAAVDDASAAKVRKQLGAWASISEIAAAKGVSRQAVSKRVRRLAEDAGLETRGCGRSLRVNLAQYDRLVGETTDPAQALRNPGGLPAGDAEEPEDRGSYTSERARREGYQAEHARLDLEERLGKIALVEEIERRNFAAARRARDRLIGLAGLLADKVISAPDARAVRMILDREIRGALDLLADEIAGKPPQGDADAE